VAAATADAKTDHSILYAGGHVMCPPASSAKRENS
jgi:hypothetical protein